MMELPMDVKMAANVERGTRVIAWTDFDPANESKLKKCSLCPWAIIPCLIPIILPIRTMYSSVARVIHEQFWVLTETELKVVTLAHTINVCCCCPIRVNQQVQVIPLANITHAQIRTQPLEPVTFGNPFPVGTPSLYVHTVSTGSHRPEAVGIGLRDIDEFFHRMMEQRNIVRNSGGGGAQNTAYSPPGGNGSVEERLTTLKRLYEQGLVSKDEYEFKRQEIISSL